MKNWGIHFCELGDSVHVVEVKREDIEVKMMFVLVRTNLYYIVYIKTNDVNSNSIVFKS